MPRFLVPLCGRSILYGDPATVNALASYKFCRRLGVTEDSRHVISPCPRRSVLDVIIAGHMFRNNRNVIGRVVRQQKGRCEAYLY